MLDREASYASSSADGAGEVLAPVILDDSLLQGDAASSRVLSQGGGASSSATMTRRDAASPCVARPLDDLLDKQPAVVEVRVRRLGRDLLHAASEVVVAVGPRFFLQMLSLVSGSHFLPASNFHPIIANCTT